MSDKQKISAQDIALFRNSIGNIRRLRKPKPYLSGAKPKPYPRQSAWDEQAVLHDMINAGPDYTNVETGEELLFSRPGLPHKQFARLRKGQFSIGGELDLHGLTIPVAHEALAKFLRNCRLRNIRCVRVIHGKGRGSKHGQPILKNKVNGWLRHHNDVLAFCSARPVDGGTGAIYVLLKLR